MPNARRQVHRRTEGKSECVEARPLFGGGYRGAALGPGTGAPKPGNSEHNLSWVAKQAALAAIWRGVAIQRGKYPPAPILGQEWWDHQGAGVSRLELLQ